MVTIRKLTVGISGESCDREIVKEAEAKRSRLVAGSVMAVAVQAVVDCYEEVEEIWREAEGGRGSRQARRWEPETWAEYLQSLEAVREAANPESRLRAAERLEVAIEAVEGVRWIWWLRARRASALTTLVRVAPRRPRLDRGQAGWQEHAWAMLASWARRRRGRVREWATAWRCWLALGGRRGGWRAAAVPGREGR